MRLLSTDEYLKEENEYIQKNTEYIKKVIDINKKEKELVNKNELSKEQEEQFKNERKKLKKEYGKYSSIYNADFYCLITFNNIYKLLYSTDVKFDSEADAKKYLDAQKKNINRIKKDIKKFVGKKVQDDCSFSTYGICKGIAVTLDDIYFVIDDEQTKKEKFVSAVGGVSLFNIWNHRSWRIVTTKDNKGYL